MLNAVTDKIFGVITEIIAGLFKLIMSPFMDLKSIKDWVFGVEGDQNLIYGIFTADEINNIYKPGFNLMLILAGFFILIGVVMYGNRIASSGINASNRIFVMEFFRDWILVSLLLFNLDILYDVIFQFNHFIVSLFSDAYNGQLASLDKDLKPDDPGLLGKMLIQFVLLGLSLWASFYYLMRKLTLMIFMILGPLMVSFLLMPWTRRITFAWIKEMTGTIFVQAIHAFLFWVVAKMAGAYGGILGAATGEGSQLIESVILYVIFIPVSEGLRSLFGLGGGLHNSWSKAGAMFGLSALAGMYGSVKGALQDKSVMSALKGAYEGIRNRKEGASEDDDTVGANTGTFTGTTPAAERMLKAGDLISKAGRAVGGVAGSLIGSPMGPYGSISMATMGAELGDTAGELTGRFGMAAAEGLVNRAKTFGKSFAEGFTKGKNLNAKSDELLADVIANSDLIDEVGPKTYEEFRSQMKERFPDIGERELQTQWDQLQEQRREAAMKLINLAKNDETLASADALKEAAVNEMMSRFEKNNKGAFMEQFYKENPLPENATDAQRLEHQAKANEAWQALLNDQRKGYEAIANDVAQTLSHGIPHSFIKKDEFAQQFASKALDFDKQRYSQIFDKGDSMNLAHVDNLKEAAVNEMMSRFEKNNKATFIEQYRKANPLADNASEMERVIYEAQANAAWNQFADKHRQGYEAIANEVADSLSITSGNGFVSKADFASSFATKAHELDKQAFVQMMGQPRQSAEIPMDDIKAATVNEMTARFDANNKQAFMKQYQQSNPLPANASEAERVAYEARANEAWNHVVAQQRKGYESIANTVAQTVGGRDEFATAFASRAFELDKQTYGQVFGKEQNVNDVVSAFTQQNGDISQYTKTVSAAIGKVQSQISPKQQDTSSLFVQQNGNINDYQQAVTSAMEFVPNTLSPLRQEVMAAFTNQNGDIRTYSNAVSRAVSSVPSGKIYDHRSVNRDYLAQSIAHARTAQQREDYIQSQLDNGVSKEVALQTWKSVEGEIYKKNLKEVAQAMPSQEAFQAVKAHAMNNSSIISGVTGVAYGALNAVMETSGIAGITRMAKETKLGHLVSVGATSAYANASMAFANTEGNVIQKTAAAITEGYQQAKQDVAVAAQTPYVTPHAAEKQALIRNMAGYAGGLVGGIRGYQKVSQLAEKISPLNKAVNQQAYEASEIYQMAQKTTDNYGNMVIAKGAVRLVTTANESYIEVKDQVGATHVVSRIGRGDSSLSKNEVVYTDLTVTEQGISVDRSNPYAYKMDSGGNRQYINRVMKIDPNQLLSNRAPKPYQAPTNIPAYNQMVEYKQFYLNDVLNAKLTNVKAVVERNRSYVIAQTPQGEIVRISPYGQGDARLRENEVVTMDYVIRNQRFIQQHIKMEVDGREIQHDYTSTFDINEYVPHRPNKRLLMRKEIERIRSPQGVK
jgi:trimeric autotransporter adhesin